MELLTSQEWKIYTDKETIFCYDFKNHLMIQFDTEKDIEVIYSRSSQQDAYYYSVIYISTTSWFRMESMLSLI
jgi:hypothetical protein